MKFRSLSFVLLAAGACTSAAPASNPGTPGRTAWAGVPVPTDPAEPVLAISESRPITDMHRRTFGFSAYSKLGLLLAGTFGFSFFLYESVLRRVKWVRPLFGIKLKGA